MRLVDWLWVLNGIYGLYILADMVTKVEARFNLIMDIFSERINELELDRYICLKKIEELRKENQILRESLDKMEKLP